MLVSGRQPTRRWALWCGKWQWEGVLNNSNNLFSYTSFSASYLIQPRSLEDYYPRTSHFRTPKVVCAVSAAGRKSVESGFTLWKRYSRVLGERHQGPQHPGALNSWCVLMALGRHAGLLVEQPPLVSVHSGMKALMDVTLLRTPHHWSCILVLGILW